MTTCCYYCFFIRFVNIYLLYLNETIFTLHVTQYFFTVRNVVRLGMLCYNLTGK